eukprot:TRINITY_DN9031_c0_g1_i4.p1 TRINITY_DN9031_c0_g1~~TRINITY_DN9031_c0_g1_i4.p1  ORF type:complete len:442 (-),score=85.65 TRINITY_DN9031_c0_g1_i4:100-1425(-)
MRSAIRSFVILYFVAALAVARTWRQRKQAHEVQHVNPDFIFTPECWKQLKTLPEVPKNDFVLTDQTAPQLRAQIRALTEYLAAGGRRCIGSANRTSRFVSAFPSTVTFTLNGGKASAVCSNTIDFLQSTLGSLREILSDKKATKMRIMAKISTLAANINATVVNCGMTEVAEEVGACAGAAEHLFKHGASVMSLLRDASSDRPQLTGNITAIMIGTADFNVHCLFPPSQIPSAAEKPHILLRMRNCSVMGTRMMSSFVQMLEKYRTTQFQRLESVKSSAIDFAHNLTELSERCSEDGRLLKSLRAMLSREMEIETQHLAQTCTLRMVVERMSNINSFVLSLGDDGTKLKELFTRFGALLSSTGELKVCRNTEQYQSVTRLFNDLMSAKQFKKCGQEAAKILTDVLKRAETSTDANEFLSQSIQSVWDLSMKVNGFLERCRD